MRIVAAVSPSTGRPYFDVSPLHDDDPVLAATLEFLRLLGVGYDGDTLAVHNRPPATTRVCSPDRAFGAGRNWPGSRRALAHTLGSARPGPASLGGRASRRAGERGLHSGTLTAAAVTAPAG